jgi:hypothetical protein
LKQLATALNVNLQKRMPPSKRWHRTANPLHEGPGAKQDDGPASTGEISERKAKKIAAGTLAVEDGQTYDMSLWKAIYVTVWRQWWFAVVLSGLGSTYHPLPAATG